MSYFACGYCQKSFSNVEAMKSHIADDHEEEFPAKNDFNKLTAGHILGNGTSRRNDDDNWTNDVFDFECFPCRLGFDNELSLQTHIEENHQFQSNLTNSKNTQNIGGKVIKNKNEMIADSQSMSRPKRKRSKISSLFENSENVSIHGISQSSGTDTFADSLEHQETVEVNPESKNETTKEVLTWSCSICEKRFQYQSRLARHSIIHNRDDQERKFECKVCQKKFLRSGN